ncbi:hypothetical protein [Pontibacter liquoris]|uniref:hypothetical protein n=1 Tax=Pontibacter liquoris TaxID=2905677 RepID=UPI001FA815A5|nr:hypothetical protein [Pontibacter liquoris]
MKKILLLLLLCFGGFNLHAQDSLSVKPAATAPYKLAIGARYYAGGPLGADVSISAKYFIGRESALEAQSNIFHGSRYFLTSLSYIWQPQLLTSSRLQPYAGLGVGVMKSRTYYPAEERVKINPVGVATFGIEYSFKNAPIALSLDYRATFLRLDNTDTPPTISLGNTSNFGLGIKYLLR